MQNQSIQIQSMKDMTPMTIIRVNCRLGNFSDGLSYARSIGEELCSDFVIDEMNRDIFNRLLQYFHGYPEFNPSEKVKGDLKKGILLIGEPGTGKTLILQLFSEYVKYDEMYFIAEGRKVNLSYQILRSNDVVGKYESEGYEIVEMLSRRRILAIDDLGEENMSAMHYGSKINVIQHLLEKRSFVNVITLATTNYKMQTLGELYGKRILSRIYEMFNIMVLPGIDRRKAAVTNLT